MLTVGEVEHRALILSHDRNHTSSSDTRSATSSSTLLSSRHSFETGRSADVQAFDRTVATSLNDFERQFELETQVAKQASMRDQDDQAVLHATLQQSEQDQIDAAMMASVGDRANVEEQQMHRALAASLHTAPQQLTPDADEELQRAIELSTSMYRSNATQSSLADEHKQAASVSSSPAVRPPPASTSSSSYPPPVSTCLQFGFSLDKCLEAYSIYSSAGTDDEVAQNMTDYLFNNQ